MQVSDLIEIEAIKRLKYRYLRCLDRMLFDELADCFAEDATASYADGKWSFSSREAIMEFLRSHAGGRVSLHAAHHPEIDLTTDTTAVGTWALEDTIFRPDGSTLHGAAHYHDTYEKTDGRWKIKSTGYERLFEVRSTMVGPSRPS
jgi:hypothetical protein